MTDISYRDFFLEQFSLLLEEFPKAQTDYLKALYKKNLLDLLMNQYDYIKAYFPDLKEIIIKTMEEPQFSKVLDWKTTRLLYQLYAEMEVSECQICFPPGNLCPFDYQGEED